ncbi:SRPBCC family protein [Chitinimonas viridis]|uniref:SRPBCC family protein n=1 Tax=Chitinimonas viridis TaxID=664880 RepID=A0ABT8BA15_9NEIS|nr:SRPBCC family protein [Chitinimonas viridis]MDN3579082.1 SRPBCC family protein [Chitinimonas viridis]
MSTRIVRTHQITLAAPSQSCHRFFTPAGECLWVAGWQPHYHYPANGQTEAGMVFSTGSDAEYTLWCLVDFDEERLYSRYTRLTPGSRSGIVEVQCHARDDQTTEVTVRYTLTALSDAGLALLNELDEATFAAMITGWQDAIGSNLPRLLAAEIA